MRGKGSADMTTLYEQGAKLVRLETTNVQMLITLFMIATISGEAFGAGAPRRPQGIPFTASEKRLFLECEKIARAQGYDSVAYTSRCRSLRPLGARLFIEKL